MVISHAALISTLSFAPLLLYGQAVPPTPPAAPPAAPVVPSTMLQPALAMVESTLNSLKVDKWKRGSVRDEASQNAQAMLSDMKSNLPPLIADADAAPGVVSKSIPLMKHLDALYDVLLRIEEAARVAAPNDQIDQLEAALKKFGSARNDLYDSLQQSATGQEKHLTDLQATIKAQEEAAKEVKPAPAPAPVPCTPPKPAPKKKRTTPPKNTQPAAASGAQTPPANNTQAPPAQPKTPQ